MAMTKEQIVNDMLASGFELDGATDYKRVSDFVLQEYKVKLTNRAVWAVIDSLKSEGLAVLDFD